VSPELQLLYVDDDDDYVRYVIEFFESVRIGDEKCEVTGCKSFGTGLEELVKHRYDLLILDVFKGNPSDNHTKGLDVFNEIRKRRFLPTVFLTARATDVLDLESPVVKVVWKTGDWQLALQKSIEEFERAGIFRLMRALQFHLEKVTREFMWRFFPDSKNFELLRREPTVAAYLLARSIGSSLDTAGASEVAREVSRGAESATDDESHPALMYVPSLMDPKGVRAGDIRRIDEDWVVVLTPSCDLVERLGTGVPSPKAKLVLCVRCALISNFAPVSAMKRSAKLEDGKRATPQAVLRILQGRGDGGYRDDQVFFLPKAFGCPGLVANLEDLVCFPYNKVNKSELSARLDSPYVEGLTGRFTRFVGRVGMPDVDFATALR
jgi:hypothetical protein